MSNQKAEVKSEKVTYEIRLDDLPWTMEVKIDHSKADEAIKEMVNFWAGSDFYLLLNEGDYLLTFLQQLGQECLTVIISHNYNLFGIQSHFNDLEGWVPMTGQKGIEIISIDRIPFEQDQFIVQKEGVYL